MDKNAIKNYAKWARRELISRVSQKALQYGISENEIVDADADTVGGHLLSVNEKKMRKTLIKKIKDGGKDGYQLAMEEAAYTWFNRFSALRFMEVNGYLPSHVRVFTDEQNAFKPQILTEAIHLELDGLDMEKVYALKEANKTEELYKYLLITQCNALSAILPGMFTRIADYTELLFPDNLLRKGSVIEQMISLIAEDDWKDAVQIIGWLYQYYNAEPKEKVFADLKKNIKISKENIPAATQLFTPDWIVRYMVENSLGRLWVEGHPNDALKANWKYYLEEAEQEPEVQAQLAEIRKEYAALKPEEIKVIDPCMGSGHILVYLFDVLVQIYESYGYNAREAVGLILQNNLYGLDIDDRAAQLAYFAVMMKARQYDRRIFSRGVQPHVYAVQESGHTSPEGNRVMRFGGELLEYVANGKDAMRDDLLSLVEELFDAKEYGSILTVTPVDFAALEARFAEIEEDISIYRETVLNQLCPFVQYAQVMAQKYEIAITNPPYMGTSGLGGKLSDYVKKTYPDSKSDLFAVFIERCRQMIKKNGYQAMITQHAWMFLSSFEKLREKLQQYDIINMAHLGARAFEEIGGEVVQTTSFVMSKRHIANYKGTYCRLIEPTTQQGKEDMFLAGENRYTAQQDNFSKISGSPVAYWMPSKCFDLFEQECIGKVFKAKVGLMTTDNERFLRFFWEVSKDAICFKAYDDEQAKNSKKKWFPHNKGGSGRKWYGNQDFVVDWENSGERIKQAAIKKYPYLNGNPNFVVHDDGYYFRESISWSELGGWGFRYFGIGFTFNVKGMSAFANTHKDLLTLIAYSNSKVAHYFSQILNPSLSFGVNSFNKIPWISSISQTEQIAENNIEISKNDWDSFETSWDFKRHPLV